MTTKTDIHSFLAHSKQLKLVDVRAPIEFAKGHIVGAINIPLFTDEERAAVGRTYKHNGREQAVLKGLDLVGPKMKALAKTLLSSIRPEKNDTPDFLVHCWRGGMRSQSMAWLAKQVGLKPIVLEGGYKAFRRHVLDSFGTPYPLMILSGLTGAGKTRVLHKLDEIGEQVLDLEGLANHRGSALGGIGLPEQPTVEHFENMMFDRLQQFDPGKNIWVEDESRKIGAATIPNSFLMQMRNSPAVFLDVPRESRAKIAIEEYGPLPIDEIKSAIQKVTKRMGGQNTKAACEALDQGNLEACVNLLLDYYDKSYLNAKAKSPRTRMVNYKTTEPLSGETVRKVVQLAQQFEILAG